MQPDLSNIYGNIDFNLNQLQESVGTQLLINQTKYTRLGGYDLSLLRPDRGWT